MASSCTSMRVKNACCTTPTLQIPSVTASHGRRTRCRGDTDAMSSTEPGPPTNGLTVGDFGP
jgi:hypothetical protein